MDFLSYFDIHINWKKISLHLLVTAIITIIYLQIF
jgi:hypothetical protein